MNYIEKLFKRKKIYTLELSIHDLIDLLLSDLLLKAQKGLTEAFKVLVGEYLNEQVSLYTDTILKLIQIWLIFNGYICTVKDKINKVIITSTDPFCNRYVTVIKRNTDGVLIETELHHVYALLLQLLNTIKNIKNGKGGLYEKICNEV